MQEDQVRIVREDILSDDYYQLKKVCYSQRRTDGRWQDQTREVYANDAGVTALLHHPGRGTVLLTRQFRPGARLAGHPGFLLETPAGMLDGADPETRIRAELMEETGYEAGELTHVMTLFASPGLLTERVHYFIGTYDDSRRRGGGGGKAEEGEDIEVVELPLEQALAMVASGDIADAKTVVLLQYLHRQLLVREKPPSAG